MTSGQRDALIFLTAVLLLSTVMLTAILLNDWMQIEAAIKMVGDGADPIKVHCLIEGVNQYNREICSK